MADSAVSYRRIYGGIICALAVIVVAAVSAPTGPGCALGIRAGTGLSPVSASVTGTPIDQIENAGRSISAGPFPFARHARTCTADPVTRTGQSKGQSPA